MNHDDIDSNQIIERYLTDKVSPEEREAFELHYLSCQDCLDQLEAAEVLRDELRNTDADSAGSEAHASPVPRNRSYLRSPAYSLAATALLGLAIVTLIYTLQVFNEERTLRLESDARLAVMLAPHENTPVVRLGATRGVRPPAAAVALPLDPGPIVLVLELNDPDYRDFSATMRHSGGEAVWTAENLVPDVTDSLVVTVHSASLEASDYRIDVRGLEANGEWRDLAGYAVRFLPAE